VINFVINTLGFYIYTSRHNVTQDQYGHPWV